MVAFVAPQSLAGKVCLVTGATSGIGRETAVGLARLGAKLIIVGRDSDRLTATARSIFSAGGAEPETLQADLLRQSEVRRLAQAFCETHDRLDVLVNNAGAMFPERKLTEDGFERTWALNHLGYFLLTLLLLDPLRAAPSARIVSVASAAHERASLDFDNLQGERGFGPMRAYSRSKLANVMFTYALARRLHETEITANCLHPGVVATRFGAATHGAFKLGLIIARQFFISAKKGAATSIYLASSPSVAGISGGYFTKLRKVASSAESHNEAKQERLWKVSLEETGAPEPSP